MTARRTIDALDAELLELLNRRGRVVLQVAALKKHQAEPRYYRPEREAVLLKRLTAQNTGPLSDTEVRRLFREIVSTCRALEHRLVIGCAPGCRYAAIGHFGGAIDMRTESDPDSALAAVATARCDYAVIEFSRGGEATPAMVAVTESELVLCGEWHAAGEERYAVIGREPPPPTGDDWTSLIAAPDRAAWLESRCGDLNLQRYRTPVAGRRLSVVDIAAHVSDPSLAHLLAEDDGCMVLGSYPNPHIDRRRG